jgi:diacylglycerol kinase (ATP)
LRVLVLHNPTAGDEKHSEESLRALIERAGHEVRFRSVKEPDWEHALDDGLDLVVAAGGDGTVRKVFRLLAGMEIPVTILPLGTANNIARSLGLKDGDPEWFVPGWNAGETRSYDIAALSSDGAEAPFVESAGAGLFADVIVRADRDRTEYGDKVEKGLRMLHASLAEGRLLGCAVELDGDAISEDLIGLELLNVSYAGPGIPLAPAADPGDGALDVALIRPGDAGPLIAYVEERLAGSSPRAPDYEVRRATEVVLRLPEGTPVHTDDEVVVQDCTSAVTAPSRGAGRGPASDRLAAG